MKRLAVIGGAVATAMFSVTATPATAQFYFKPKELPTGRITGEEPGMLGAAMPGATREELDAAMVWNLRAALNVAALQCQFEPTLLTLRNYNGMLKDHEAELAASFATLGKYFRRVNKTPKEGQTAFDQFGTKVYSGFSTVSAQRIFCQTAGVVGEDVVHTPRGQLADVAATRLRELRGSLTAWGEQQFAHGGYGYTLTTFQPRLPDFANLQCWRKDIWQERRCGMLGEGILRTPGAPDPAALARN
ncbi:hypothetical protein COC42_10910 [Sphingomonas spermidinifaciens]|uniref:Uncharacterized protein n=1 Tax=Sphingomonas spermidinifaciens TaxID=1141889 RepID=A0A2A4AYI1_9SPHN|nr:hypothetical protein [Sphingomonas spermidinifaciens]PCD01993.1 hypothetical protein COC42_10910 [Sphingomonas spermidinifaciens]